MTMHAIEDMPHMFSPTSGEPLYAAWQLKAAYAAGMERAAEIIDSMNDNAGDRASYDNREMYDDEITRMHALSDCADAIRAEIKGE